MGQLVSPTGLLLPMRMNLNATSTIPSGSGSFAPATVTGMTADAAYPDTVISSNQLQAKNKGTGLIDCAYALGGNTLGSTVQLLLRQNSTTIASTTFTANGTYTLSVANSTVNKGDLVYIQVSTNAFSGSISNTATSGTFVRFR